MPSHFEVVIAATGQSLPLADSPLTAGRGPGNDLVLSDDAISWHHAQLWLEGGRPWIRDLGSRNGTFVNGNRINGSMRMADGDAIKLGPVVELQVRGAADALPARFRVRHLVDLSSSLRFSMTSDRFRIGSGADCDLRLDDGPARLATLLLHDNGEIWVGTSDGDWQVAAGEPFEVGGRKLKVVEETPDHAPTVDFGGSAYPYTLRIGSDVHGPHGVLVDPAGARELLLTGNKGVLLYVLGQRLLANRSEGTMPGDEGWCATNDVLTSVWGRGQASSNHLNVLVHRTRQFLEAEGFEPWCIEKRRGAVRVRVRVVEQG
jgi:hypothetical protein